MLTLTELATALSRLVERAHDAKLDPVEIADALQAELDELDVVTGPAVRSEVLNGD